MGVAISDKAYTVLYEAYLATGSIERAARSAGVEYKTALKYVNKGDVATGREAIKDRKQRLEAAALNKIDNERAQALDVHKRVGLHLLGKHADALKQVTIQLKGEPGPNGGIVIDEQGAGAVIRNFKGLLDYEAAIETAREGRPQDVGVNVNINNTAVAGIQQQGGQVVRDFETNHRDLISGDPNERAAAEHRFTAAVLAEARIRARDHLPEEEDFADYE